MSYSDLYVKKKVKVPTILGVLVLIGSILFMAQFFLTDTPPLRATQITAQNIRVANIAPSGATIMWTTDEPTNGWILYGTSENNISSIQIDERDFQNKKNLYKNHYVTLKTLLPNQKYFYKLVVNNRLVTAAENRPFELQTLDAQTKASSLPPAYGKVLRTNGAPLTGGIVVLEVAGAYPLSTITKETGEWLIPLNYIIDKGSANIKAITPNDQIKITVFDETGKDTAITTNSVSLSPIPETTVVGGTYNFIKGESVLSASTVSPTPTSSKIEFIFPKDNSKVQTKNLLIKGFASPGAEVAIEIEGPSRKSIQVRADSFGVFRSQVADRLETGNYTITARSRDAQGNELAAHEPFVVETESQVLAEVTSSATLTLTASPTISASSATTSPETTVGGIKINPFAFISISLVILGAGLLLAF